MSSIFGQPEKKKAETVVEVLESKIRPQQKANQRYDYSTETCKPIVCLAFVLPIMLWYEISMLIHPEAIRSGVDRLFLYLLSPAGTARIVALPICTVGALLFWHHQRDESFNFRVRTLLGMAIESVALALILFFACDAFMLYLDNQRPQPLAGLVSMFIDPQQYSRLLTCIGSGIHEEFIFRLILFAPLYHFLVKKTGDSAVALTVAAIVVSLLFATVHCDVINPEGYPFQSSTFLFRFLASLFLCVLFRFRGFGIAVGVHAVFDILAIS